MIELPDIAFIGRAGSGKDTCAELLQEYGYMRFALADPLKDVAATIWGEDARTDRTKLQKLGVAVREIQADSWVQLLLRSIALTKASLGGPSPRPVAVTDVRFPNEAEALRGRVKFVRVTAPRLLRITRLQANGKLQDESQLEHESETALDSFEPDYHVTNDGDRGELARQLVDILNKERR